MGESRKKKKVKRPRAGLARLGLGRARGILPWIAGVVGLSVERHLVPDIAGPFQSPLDKAITGGILYAAGLDNQDLLTAGIKEGLSTAVDTYLLPRLGIMPKGAVAPAGASYLQPMVIP